MLPPLWLATAPIQNKLYLKSIRWESNRRRDAHVFHIFSRTAGSMWLGLLLLLVASLASAKRAPSAQESAVIEEVTAKQLERILAEKDYVAVFWCK